MELSKKWGKLQDSFVIETKKRKYYNFNRN